MLTVFCIVYRNIMTAVPKSPRAPAGRTIELRFPLSEIVEKVSTGELVVGDDVGVCSPHCGAITIKMSSTTAVNAGKKYASCSAHSDEAHKCSFWCEKCRGLNHGHCLWKK